VASRREEEDSKRLSTLEEAFAAMLPVWLLLRTDNGRLFNIDCLLQYSTAGDGGLVFLHLLETLCGLLLAADLFQEGNRFQRQDH